MFVTHFIKKEIFELMLINPIPSSSSSSISMDITLCRSISLSPLYNLRRCVLGASRTALSGNLGLSWSGSWPVSSSSMPWLPEVNATSAIFLAESLLLMPSSGSVVESFFGEDMHNGMDVVSSSCKHSFMLWSTELGLVAMLNWSRELLRESFLSCWRYRRKFCVFRVCFINLFQVPFEY